MQLEQQVVSLELAKQLKELGVKQDSYFCWFPVYDNIKNRFKTNENPDEVIDVEAITGYHLTTFVNSIKGYSAFTVAELGEMLPQTQSTRFYFQKLYNGWRSVYDVPNGYAVTDVTEADARAKTLIWLIENKYISFEGDKK